MGKKKEKKKEGKKEKGEKGGEETQLWLGIELETLALVV